jgi:5-methylcytosine-specific restriction endonuclease McrA
MPSEHYSGAILKKEEPLPYLVALIVLLALLVLMVQYWYITLPLVLLIIFASMAPRVIRNIRKERYFASEAFLAHKADVSSIVDDHNEIAKYAAELRKDSSFQIGASSTGTQAHLATFENTSEHRYRRDRNEATYSASNVHNCSLQVVRNAKADPLKYLMKYFDIKASEAAVEDIERLGESISRFEGAIQNLRRREQELTGSFDPPPFILKWYLDEFMSHVGIELAPVDVPYPEYRFEYVSAGGNSSQSSTVRLNTPTIDQLIETLSLKIRFRRSAEGQRALMTANLRGFIKNRDGFACRYCSVSVAAEPNLLLEIDHIVPVSRGGLSTVDNLQTLCWRCNRTKSNKLPAT